MHGLKLHSLPCFLSTWYAWCIASCGLGKSKKTASIVSSATRTLPSSSFFSRNPFARTSLCVTVTRPPKPSLSNSSLAFSDLTWLNSYVNRCPPGKTERIIEVDRLPEPVPDSTTRRPGLSYSLNTT